MAGHGNITAPTTDPSDLADDHKNTRLGVDHHDPYSGGHDTYGSGTTGGAGFGNKSAPDPGDLSESDLKLSSTPSKHPSQPSVGAGYGNKTGGFQEKHDSTIGKLVEKAGHVMHNENLEHKGRHMREEKGFGQTETS